MDNSVKVGNLKKASKPKMPAIKEESLGRKLDELRTDIENALVAAGHMTRVKEGGWLKGSLTEVFPSKAIFYETYDNYMAVSYTRKNGAIELGTPYAVERKTTWVPKA